MTANNTHPVIGSRRLDRRDVLRLGGAGLAAVSLSGCDFLSTDPAGSNDGGGDNGGGGGSKGKESPTLAEQVEKGDLPAVEERLPKTPMVLETAEIGRYGGDLRMVMQNVGGDQLNTTLGYENLLRWKPGATDLTPDQVIPNVAEDFEIGADGAEYTFHLRDGMKWSDGEPFGVDDILFWYEDVAMNKDLRPGGVPEWMNMGGKEPLKVEKVDDRTVVFRFSKPNGLFLVNMATQRGGDITSFPSHYLKRFHKKYADNVEQLAKKEKLEGWVQLFESKASVAAPPGPFWQNPDVPVLNAWVMTKEVGANSQRPIAERNPYYWKTDSEGSQLPYLDRLTFEMIQEAEPAVLKVTNGEVDLVDRGINTLRNKPVFAKAREKAGFEFFETIPQQMNQMIIMINLTHKKKELREIFSNKDFRIGLSHALNRTEIINTVFARQGEPWQAAPRPESPHYNEKLAKQYTDYDLDKAKEHLDKVLPKTNYSGIRLRKDGKPLSFQIEVSTGQTDLVDALEFVKLQWREAGIDVGIKSEDGSLFGERMTANAHDACVWIGGGGLGPTMDPFYYMPHNFNTRWAMPWSFWFVNPEDKAAEEPPAPAKKQIEIYRQLLNSPDQQEQIDLMKQITDIAAEQFWCMGVALRKREYGIANTSLRNTPKSTITGWLHANLMPTNPQQYFLAE